MALRGLGHVQSFEVAQHERLALPRRQLAQRRFELLHRLILHQWVRRRPAPPSATLSSGSCGFVVRILLRTPAATP